MVRAKVSSPEAPAISRCGMPLKAMAIKGTKKSGMKAPCASCTGAIWAKVMSVLKNVRADMTAARPMSPVKATARGSKRMH